MTKGFVKTDESWNFLVCGHVIYNKILRRLRSFALKVFQPIVANQSFVLLDLLAVNFLFSSFNLLFFFFILLLSFFLFLNHSLVSDFPPPLPLKYTLRSPATFFMKKEE